MSSRTSRGASSLLILLLVILILLVAAVAFGFLRVSQTREAMLPKLSVSGGQAPKFDVAAVKIDIGSKQKTIAVPKVGTETKTVEVPTISVTKPAQ